MNGREPLYIQAGMNEGDLMSAFNARNPYYRTIAAGCVWHARKIRSDIGSVIDVLARTGYAARAFQPLVRRVHVVEHRPGFVDYLKNEFAPDPCVDLGGLGVDITKDPSLLSDVVDPVDAIVCCEQASLLQPVYPAFAEAAHLLLVEGVLIMTLGPSHHKFTTFKIADHRSGVVKDGEIMSELSHPVRQAVHAEIVRLAKERHGFDRDDAWPPAAKAYDVGEVRAANEAAGFENFAVIEERFRVPGHQIHLYDQNGWTFYMRWAPLSDLTNDEKVALLRDAIDAVRARPEYDDWCKVDAYHPVAYYLAY